ARPVPPKVDSIADIIAIPVVVDGLPPLSDPLVGFWPTAPATSTNFQRKRASYVLKTYFCDDLTPLSITPAEEANDAGVADGGDGGAPPPDVHASNANCQACHYRLDPIGALFRNRGA